MADPAVTMTMPTWATGKQPTSIAVPKHQAAQRGFTLIELLIALTVLALIYGAMFSQLGRAGRDDTLRGASQAFVSRLRLAQDEAILRGQEIGLRAREHGYAFQEYDEAAGLWRDLARDEHLKGADFGDELTLELEIDAQLIPLDDELERRLQETEGAEKPEPQIWVLPDGGVEPEFAIRFHRDPREPAYEVKLSRLGKLEQRSMDALF